MKVGICQQKLEKFCGLNRNFDQKQAAYNSCFNILADLVELRAIITNPFNQNYSAIKSASILKQQDVGNNFTKKIKQLIEYKKLKI